MVVRTVFATLVLLALTGLVKAHIHFLRLVVLALAGLGGLYMMHLLAQDYVKIRPRPQQAGRLLQSALRGISKRSLQQVRHLLLRLISFCLNHILEKITVRLTQRNLPLKEIAYILSS